MPFRKKIADIDLRIEELRRAIHALRAGRATRPAMERALADLARMKAERMRLLMRQVNIDGARARNRDAPAGGPKGRSGAPPSGAD